MVLHSLLRIHILSAYTGTHIVDVNSASSLLASTSSQGDENPCLLCIESVDLPEEKVATAWSMRGIIARCDLNTKSTIVLLTTFLYLITRLNCCKYDIHMPRSLL
jgi:hypothetical protein